jgi:hypothetical protein
MDDRFATSLAEDQHRRCAAALFNGVWALMEQETRTTEEDEVMVHAAHASRWHWGVVGKPVNRARGEWQISRVYSILGKGVQAREHADRYLLMCDEHDLGEFDRAFAHEAIARAAAIEGESKDVADHVQYGLAAAGHVEDEPERAWILRNLGTVTTDPPPGSGP